MRKGSTFRGGSHRCKFGQVQIQRDILMVRGWGWKGRRGKNPDRAHFSPRSIGGAGEKGPEEQTRRQCVFSVLAIICSENREKKRGGIIGGGEVSKPQGRAKILAQQDGFWRRRGKTKEGGTKQLISISIRTPQTRPGV